MNKQIIVVGSGCYAVHLYELLTSVTDEFDVVLTKSILNTDTSNVALVIFATSATRILQEVNLVDPTIPVIDVTPVHRCQPGWSFMNSESLELPETNRVWVSGCIAQVVIDALSVVKLSQDINISQLNIVANIGQSVAGNRSHQRGTVFCLNKPHPHTTELSLVPMLQNTKISILPMIMDQPHGIDLVVSFPTSSPIELINQPRVLVMEKITRDLIEEESVDTYITVGHDGTFTHIHAIAHNFTRIDVNIIQAVFTLLGIK